MCPRCQIPTEVTEKLSAVITDYGKVMDEVIPRNGIIPEGPVRTLWKIPLAAKVQILVNNDQELHNQQKAFSGSAPNVAAQMFRNIQDRPHEIYNLQLWIAQWPPPNASLLDPQWQSIDETLRAGP